jgi:hypothetical protein
MRTPPLAGLFLAGTLAACGNSTPLSHSESPAQDGYCGDYSEFRNAYFGDLHVHTANSFDAYMFGNHMNDPAVAYDFAQGRRIRLNDSPRGERYVQLRRALDFAAVTDHSEYLGEVRLCTDRERNPLAYYDPVCIQFRANQPNDTLGFLLWGTALTPAQPGRPFPFCIHADCPGVARSVWEESARITDSRNHPCSFTTFNAYEYSPSTDGTRLHRNIVFKGRNVAPAPVSYFEAPQPMDLFRKLNASCSAADGCEYLSIPHNPNLSHGRLLWTDPQRFSDAQYVEDLREIARVNPVLEMMQVKGNSECKLGLGTTDEECEFEQLREKPLCCDAANGITQNCIDEPPLPPLPFLQEPSCHRVCPGDRPDYNTRSTDNSTGCLASHDFIRGAFLKGMAAQRSLGFNPLRFGLIASTDNHNSAPGDVDEAGPADAPLGWEGAHGGQDDEPAERLDVLTNIGRITNPGGLAGVWAEENTRDALHAALQRGEVFATSGTRMKIRFFAGDYPAGICGQPDAAMKRTAYTHGVPMGGDAAPQGGGSPRFVVEALADEQPLQRAQIVKLWVDDGGAGHEKIFDLRSYAPVAEVGDDCAVTPRAPVDSRMSDCLEWQDPEFDPNQTASYYARVFEDASCRWTGHLCNALRRSGQVDCAAAPGHACCTDPESGGVKKIIQERAWSSPIWYSPVGSFVRRSTP